VINKKLVIIIPARMNSKGIIKKNLKKINGKSLINITINQALKLNPHKIIISSEDQTLEKKIIKKNNYFFYRRPTYLSKDNVHTVNVVLDCIKKFNVNKKSLVGMMLPTYPLREIDKIKKNINKYNYKKTYSLIAVTKTKFNNNNIRFLDKSKNLIADNFDLSQRQNSKTVYYVNGAFFLTICKNLLKNKNFHNSKNMQPIFCDPKKSIDINDLSDLKAARKHFK